ncbi:MAG: hypothetical protein KDE50_22925, partial [Caldilineaceae bacterium]|nr:hypothetical protein [Caldilineaceae bacterium]
VDEHSSTIVKCQQTLAKAGVLSDSKRPLFKPNLLNYISSNLFSSLGSHVVDKTETPFPTSP